VTSGVRALQAILDLRYPPLFLSHIPLGSLHRPSLTLFRVIPIAYVPFCIVFGHSLLYGLSSRFSLLDLRIYIQERAPFPSKQTYLTTGYKFTLALHCTAITLISAASGIRFLVIYPQPYLDTLQPRLSFLEGARKQTHSLATRNAL
jgi:hypothetical protein